MKLCMIGTGYVGLVSGVCFADLGNDVICVDKDLSKINSLQKSIIPIYEPGLEELVRKNSKSGRLKFSTDLSTSIQKSDIIFICVGTPTKKNKYEADVSQVYSVANIISKNIKEATERVAGEGNVKIILTHTPPFSRDMLSEEAKLILNM